MATPCHTSGFNYGEAGTFTVSSARSGQPAEIRNFGQLRAWFVVARQRVMPPGTGAMPILLAVTDPGVPRLTRYRRVLVEVSE